MTNNDPEVKIIIRRFGEKVKRLVSRLHKKDKPHFHCPVCDRDVLSFQRLADYYYEMLDRHQFIHPYFQMETINRLHYACPHCGASDRDRLYALYFKQIFSCLGTDRRYDFLDIAPMPALSRHLKRISFLNYRSADISMNGVDLRLDIQDMSFLPGETIDILLCSHVLEHVGNDRQAVAEMYRVLKTGGFGIVMVPILLSLQENYENKKAASEADRWRHFGQGDHVRVYSRHGFITCLTDAGFKVKQLGIDFFGDETFCTCGIHPRSVLYVVEK